MVNPLSLNWQNYIDILIVAVLIYSVYIWLRGTRAFHILIGLGGLGMLYVLASWSGLFLTSWLFQYLLGVILLLTIIIFQPEIRQLLEKVSPLAILKLKGGLVQREILTEVAEASFRLGDQRIGALLVFPRATPVKDVVQDGIPLDSVVSQELLISIFQRSSPIHDGAVVIEKNRIIKAACYLPLSTREGLPPKYGTRHRAAIGLTEETDSICVVVSEERGAVSITQNGEIETVTGEEQLRNRLEQALLPQITPPSSLRETVKETLQNWFDFQEFVRKNFAAKLLAIGLSCLLWYTLVGQQWSETFMTGTLEYVNIPEGLDIVSNPPSGVEVRVRGPRGSISTLRAGQIRVVVNLKNAKVGKNTFLVTEKDVALPFGLEATSIEPQTLSISFDRIITRRFAVFPARTGTLPKGLRLDYMGIEPNTIELRGPLSEIERIQRVTIPPIDLSSISQSQTITSKVQIEPPLSSALRTPIPEVKVTLSVSRIPEERQPTSGDSTNVSAVSGALAQTDRKPLDFTGVVGQIYSFVSEWKDSRCRCSHA